METHQVSLEVESIGWAPRLNPVQQKAYDSVADYILMYGEKGSGKSTGGIHALIRHCYDEEEALALVVAPAIRTGKEGVFYELQKALDIWKNGNLAPDGETRVDGGMGLEFTEPTLDAQTKDRHLFIYNRHGGKSKVILISIPYEESVSKRMKALSPSFVYIDEITELGGKDYFTFISAQLGRRKKIKGPQQYYASCNPEGPSNWVYEVFFMDCIDAETGVRDPKYEVYHLKVSENVHNLPPGYLERLDRTIKDTTDRARLIEGRWIDRPSGDAIFKDYFNQDLHVRPPLGSDEHRRGMGLTPHQGLPIILGYDPGPNNYCITFMQMIPVKDRGVLWIVFDELIFVGEHRPDFYVAKRLLERMDFWTEKTNGACSFVHIGDQSAFTHQRNDGSFDATRMKTLTNNRVIMRPFAQNMDSKGSVPARIGMLRALMSNNCFFVSCTCPKTIEALRLIASKKQKPGDYDDMAGLTPKRSPYLHPFDSLSYPIFFTQLYPSAFALQVDDTDEKPFAFRAGSG